ncbi:hypothetical protein Aple_013200 [Acrocarpospora pleiomorpha]|uniref:SRPBCC family protein n=1 Tax=Acrocarpospora pleiomorpha TaxID=90975 RepID=A0A5M3X9L3_9ACTN|nr:SRPBCC family protein [Acrocarpospora pleiomorpha]GES18425.1 hypothetical protein Aple_013200 [Acrocarpospora pleiomorpha]
MIRSLVKAGVAVGAVTATYALFLRKWSLTWGATPEEAGRELPGDELLPPPCLISTRAVTIGATTDAVWPWLVQMGSGRAGAYTYDWIENLLGLNMHSADKILPEYQDLKVGDKLPLGDTGPVMCAEIVEPGRALVFRSGDGTWVWAFILLAQGKTTRLISRNRISTPDAGPSAKLLNLLIVEPGSLIMERKMLLGIRERAERTTPEGTGVQVAGR